MNNNLINIIDSGSQGNCYFIDSRPPIILEAGVSLQRVRRATNYRLNEVEACFVTHPHRDHSGYIKDMLKYGIECYMTAEVQSQLGIKSPLTHLIEPLRRFKVGDKVITPFDVKHDTEDPLGFIIEFDDEKILYSGDTAYIKYNFKNLTRIMIECNWYKDVDINIHQKRRLIKTHMSLQNVKNFVNSNDLSKVKEILLLHISSNNGNPKYFKKVIQQETGKIVRYK